MYYRLKDANILIQPRLAVKDHIGTQLSELKKLIYRATNRLEQPLNIHLITYK